MDLAKPCLDVGLYTGDLDAHRRFWEDEVGCAYQGYLKLGGGVRQHRFGLDRSVVKVNHARDRLPDSPSGLRRLTVTSSRVEQPVELDAPDGLAVRLVPVGHDGPGALVVEVAASDVEATRRWWSQGLGAEDGAEDGDEQGGDEQGGEERGATVAVGTTVVAFVADPDRLPTGELQARGLRYLTVQVPDVVAAYERFVSRGSGRSHVPHQAGRYRRHRLRPLARRRLARAVAAGRPDRTPA